MCMFAGRAASTSGTPSSSGTTCAADAAAAGAYAQLKRALAEAAPDDWDAYYLVKDPACDLIVAAAEQWAARTAWTPPPPDA